VPGRNSRILLGRVQQSTANGWISWRQMSHPLPVSALNCWDSLTTAHELALYTTCRSSTIKAQYGQSSASQTQILRLTPLKLFRHERLHAARDPEKLTVAQLVNRYSAFHGACHWTLP
jgi:hypothetical protein